MGRRDVHDDCRCLAVTVFSDGNVCRCAQYSRNGSRFCYYHEKMANGFLEPYRKEAADGLTEFDYNPEEVFDMKTRRNIYRKVR